MTDSDKLRTSYLIKRAELLVRTNLEAALRDLGVTAGQYAVLSLLASMPEVSSAQLSRSVGVTPQTMTETILLFEKNDLIQRERSAQHGRILKITITPDGLALLKTCEARVTAIENELFGEMTPDDVRQFRSLLSLILRGDEAARA
jgi:DNA-binding MarR family transcriptional regulator